MVYFEKKIENKIRVAENLRLKLLSPPTDQVRVVMDTDTFNEIDDQFAIVQRKQTWVITMKFASLKNLVKN